ncbi:helix-turn-helix transcriptional regulator [Nonomuraea recticatena]|uniref:HTH cro/C1-type domain-containing protein n=1 Tax=Nonomuraea recticatena TaxID=46178 RepID=A0ABP6F8M4_9ACTN
MALHPMVAELDALRVELGLAEQIVAEVVGVDAMDVGWWAAGLRTPTLRQFVGYAALLGRRLAFANEHGQIEFVDQVPILVGDDPPERLRVVLERRRERRNVSRRAVAQTVGVSPAVFNRWANGDRPLPLDGLIGWAAAVGWTTGLAEAPEEPFDDPVAAAPRRPRAERRRPPRVHPLLAQLEQIRHARRVSQIAVAEATGVHKNTVGRWATGERTPSVENLVDLARALDCDVYIGPPADQPPLTPQAEARQQILLQIDLARGNRDQRTGRRSHDDGTGPQWRQAASDALGEEIVAEQRDETTWALRARTVLADALQRDDPAELRAGVLQAAATLVAWLEDLDARTAGGQDEQEVGDG